MQGSVRVASLPGAPVFEPGQTSGPMADALEAAGAQSFVVIPTRKPGRRFSLGRERPIPAMDGWLEAEIVITKPAQTVRALVGFDVARRSARSLARELGVPEFLWGTRDAPVETHVTDWYDQGEWSEWGKVKEKAWTGVPDFVRSLTRLRERGFHPDQDDRAPKRNPLTTTAAASVAAVACVVALLPVPSLQPFEAAFGLLHLLAHPALVTAACLGLLLRPELAPGRLRERDATAAAYHIERSGEA